ncbi:hypothetical protein MMC06_002851 [Schaereria dolodes]|nr:hypothetical protein [Schaereria dolodes]
MSISSDAQIALVALVISLFALVVTSIQLLTQIFATADGTRKCSTSVMGKWGQYTKWRWRWSEGRYETLYTTPEFQLVEPRYTTSTSQNGPGFAKTIGDGFDWLGDWRDHSDSAESIFSDTVDGPQYMIAKDSHLQRLVPNEYQRDLSYEKVGWILLLQALFRNATDVQNLVHSARTENVISWPSVQLRRRSWDFMPPDAMRPLATSNISDIAIIVRRLGMIWKQFDPTNGNMTAEAGPHVLTAMTLRGVGLVLQYKYSGGSRSTYTWSRKEELVGNKRLEWLDQDTWKTQQINIWTREVDKIFFGICPGNIDFSLPDFYIATLDNCLNVLEDLNEGDTKVQGLLPARNWKAKYAINEIIPMAAPMLRLRGSSERRLPFCGYWACLLTFPVSNLVFHRRLQQHLEQHDNENVQTRWLLKSYDDLEHLHGLRWDLKGPERGEQTSLPLFELLHDYYDATTQYFKRLEIRQNSRIMYYDLVKAHFSKAPYAFVEAFDKMKKGEGRDQHLNKDGHRWRSEQMNLYFDYIPDYIKFMEKKGYDDGRLVTEAWLTLIFRAFLWSSCHEPYPCGDYLPMEYYDSQIPVYLG